MLGAFHHTLQRKVWVSLMMADPTFNDFVLFSLGPGGAGDS
jgi:hypothetical protein